MRLAIVGGKLQGIEAAYLAGKAGYETVLVDRREAPPAAGLADVHVVMDVTADEARSRAVLGACDAVLPACEDDATLDWLDAHVSRWGVPLLFDRASYAVTSSKLASNELFERLDVPRPRPWPGCPFPVVVKPSSASGSEGVRLVTDEAGLDAARAALEAEGHAVVTEEFVGGPSLSLEVLRWAGRSVPLQVTGLEFDAGFDCKRVVAPVGEAPPARCDGARVERDGRAAGAGFDDAAGTDLNDAGATSGGAAPCGAAWACAVPTGVLAAFDVVATTLADGLGLQGVMDVEVMVHDGEPKVLEIDARLPSQTPTAVYWSSGLNLVELLCETARDGRVPRVDRTAARACVFQHVHVRDGRLEVAGEHVMSGAGPLALVPGFFGAHEALTDYEPGRPSWSATLITLGTSVGEAQGAADGVVAALAVEEGLEVVSEGER